MSDRDARKKKLELEVYWEKKRMALMDYRPRPWYAFILNFLAKHHLWMPKP